MIKEEPEEESAPSYNAAQQPASNTDAADSEKHYVGTGVGLAMVKKGLERINGSIDIDPSVVQGSCFVLCFQPPREL